MTNPLLAAWTTPYGLPPFAEIAGDDFAEAVDAALAEARANVAAIAEQIAPPSFDNTVAALERADETLGRMLGAFYTLAGTDSNPRREELMRAFSPKLAAYSSEVRSNPDLFARIEALWQARDTLGLTPEQDRLLYLTRRNFVRSGAQLGEADRARLAEVTQRLAELGTQFAQNILADERDWALPLSEAELADLPGFVADAARAAGAERGADGAVVTLSRSLIVPFLQFCPRRELRREAFEAWAERGAKGGETDNRGIAAEILALRAERARLLGYASFAAFKLETEMAGSPAAARQMLEAVWQPARAQAEADGAVLAGMMQADGVNDALAPWDWRYYAERRRRAEHDLDEEQLKPYFQLERMIAAAFDCANRLFGLEFREVDVPLHHPDARAWEVTRDGRHMALFAGDYFARASKRSGAWCSTMRRQQKLAGDIRPIVVNVCNFAKPPAGRPALLSYDDARTLFHEFGHALHNILSDVTHESVSGTSVARDFVELPSQLFEHWLEVPEVLDRFATHAETGAPLPPDLRDRLLAARNFDQGFATVEYTASALVDLALHEGTPPDDVVAREAEVLEEIGMPHAIAVRHAAPHFAHVFAGDGYSAGYYSYMWSEMMDADAFATFEAACDPFDPATATALEREILSAGGSAEPETLYRAFRGRLPGVEALLAGRGLGNAA